MSNFLFSHQLFPDLFFLAPFSASGAPSRAGSSVRHQPISPGTAGGNRQDPPWPGRAAPLLRAQSRHRKKSSTSQPGGVKKGQTVLLCLILFPEIALIPEIAEPHVLPASRIWGNTMIMHPRLILLFDSDASGRSDFGGLRKVRMYPSLGGAKKGRATTGTLVVATSPTTENIGLRLPSDTQEWCDFE
ncbi:hypothetical protein F5144DRAFT_353597 [Chaetomium tenue]|uniref:Uncharacterized protein n=1 Tax=Chaetomium tenue TaxID=1854479 RepID=A0ACB7NXJ5_9PEZI|nr:hypothetical protein F5144DRAFT_353597 [Chaetomium globosum]